MATQKLGWSEATQAFIVSRFVILGTSWIGLGIFPLYGTKNGLNCIQQASSCLLTWNYWDLLAYSDIAHYGYHLAQNTVFFPLWPLCLHMLGSLAGGTEKAYFFSALLLANIFFFLALLIFFLLVSKLFDDSVAHRALFCLALYPYALFFFTGYSEALFLLLSLATFYCLQSQHFVVWLIAGLWAGLATLTRATGLMLIVPLSIVYAQRFLWKEQWWKRGLALLSTLLPLISIGGYALFLKATWKNPLLFIVAEQAGWGRHSALPWVGLVETITALLTGYQLLHNALDLVFTVFPLIVLIVGWRWLPVSYRYYALAMMLFLLSNPSVVSEPLASAPRYMLTIFPCFVLLGRWCKDPLFMWIYKTVSVALLVILTLFFVHHYWVA